MLNISLIFIIIIIDQITKFFVESNLINTRITVIDKFFYLTYLQNTGGAWGLLENNNMIFIIAIPMILIAIIIYLFKGKNISRLEKIGFCVLIGGAIGNYIDRVFRGYVVDFIDFVIWPVFNVADIAVVVGVGLIILSLFVDKESFKASRRAFKLCRGRHGNPPTKK